MAEKPILFSGPMVSAILEGRKTQTRRVMKPQPRGDYTLSPLMKAKEYLGPSMCGKMGCYVTGHMDWAFFCPAYQPGDRLWVRETWAYATGPNRDEPDTPEHYGFIYREEWDRLQPGYPLNGEWKPSIFMPKKAARIWLEVTDVRAERLQDISEEDAIAEGVECEVPGCSSVYWNYLDKLWDGAFPNDAEARASFQTLWESINSKRHGCSWSNNPWCWVISFERIRP